MPPDVGTPEMREARCPYCEREVLVYETPPRCPLCAFPLGLTRGQHAVRDRLRLVETRPIDEQADAPLPDLAEEARVLVPPHDPGLLELARDGLGVIVGEGAEMDGVDLVAHGTSTAVRHPRTELTSASSSAPRSSFGVMGRSARRASRSSTVR